MKSCDEIIQQILPHPKVDAFRICYHPYYIFSLEYMQNSIGLRAYYYLCHILNELGYEAYVISEKLVAGLRTPILTDEIRRKHKEEERHPIVVYGEAIQGNPLDGDVVVRWLLNNVGHVGADVEFGKNDLRFYWSTIFSKGEGDVELLFAPTIDRSIFNKNGVNDNERSGFCYFASKYLYLGNCGLVAKKIRDNGISLCKDIERTHTEIADILRHSKVLYCYEPSAIAMEAVLCGCSVIIVKTDYLNDFYLDDSLFPIIEEDEIDFDYIPDIYEKCVTSYNDRNNKSWETIGQFIQQTQTIAREYSSSKKEQDEFTLFLNTFSSLYIYGTGRFSRLGYLVIKSLGVSVSGFVVSDKIIDIAFKPEKLFDCPVFHLSDIETEKETCGVILAMRIANQDEVITILDERGFKNYIRSPLMIR